MRIWYAIIAGVVALVLLKSGQLAWLMPGSELSPFETRIEGPASELMRRSSELQKNFEAFRACQDNQSCDSTSILRARDEIIKTEWPKVYHRLTVRQDWGTCIDCGSQHEEFEAALADVGEFALQTKCVPVLSYRAWSDGYKVYDSTGYDCGDGKRTPTYPWERAQAQQKRFPL